MSSEAVTAILFGKLPAHGDFVARGLSPADQTIWDEWLSNEMAHAAQTHGEAFRDNFDRAPVWRFAVPDGAAYLSGALAASSDSSGRRFPLLAARRTASGAADIALACEDRIYTALGETWHADRLHAEIVAIPDAADAGAADGWWTEGNALFPPARLAGIRPAGIVAAMLTPQETPA